MNQMTIQQFLDGWNIPYLYNYNYISKDSSGLSKKNGFTIHSDYTLDQIKKYNTNLQQANIQEDNPYWVNPYYRFMEEIFILDIDDTTISVEEINQKVKGVFGFIPPYTLSSTKKRPHYILNIENFPNRDTFKQSLDCFIPFKGDLLIHVVEKSNEVIRELVLNEDGDIVFTTLDWNKIKDNFNLNSFKKVKEVKEAKEVMDIVLNDDFKEQIELIKASKYYNEAFDLVNIKVDGEKFRFKATSRYNCIICKREHIKNNQHLFVDCSKGGIILSCRDKGTTVVIKNRENFKSSVCKIEEEEEENLVEYKDCKYLFELDNLHFYCTHTKKFYCKEILIDGSINYNPHTAQEFKTANCNIYYDEVVQKMTKSGVVRNIEKKSFISRWITDEDRKQIVDFTYNVDPDYIANKDYINLWNGFDILKTELKEYSDEEKSNMIDIVEKFFKNLGGSSKNADDISAYFKNWVAHIIQRPHIKQITVPYLQSDEQGAGKTTLPVFIGYILGDPNCLKYVIISNGFDELNETFNTNLRDCYVFCADELKPEDGTASYNKFKKETSSPNRKINTKYGDVIMIPNKIQMCITSNEPRAIPIPPEQRRVVASELTTDLHRLNWFSEYFYPLLKDKSACRFIYEYLKNLNISEYNPTNIPESDYAKLISESSKALIEKYIDANYAFISTINESITGDAFCNNFNNWCEKNKIKAQTPASIGLYLAKNKYAKLLFNKKKTMYGITYSINKEEVDKYFNKMCSIDF